MKKAVTSCIIVFSIGMAIGLAIYKLFHHDSYAESFDSKFE